MQIIHVDDLPRKERGLVRQQGRRLVDLIEEYFRLGFTSRHRPETIRMAHRVLGPFVLWVGKRSIDASDYTAYCAALVALCQDWVSYIVGKYPEYWTANIYIKEVGRFFNWCVRSGYMLFNPMQRTVKPIQPVRRRPIFTHAEYQYMKKRAKNHLLYPMIVLGYRTGMSISDCALLKWDEVDMENLVIHRVRLKTAFRGLAATIPIIPGSDLHELLLFYKNNPCEKWYGYDEDYVNPEMAFRYRRCARASAMCQVFTLFIKRIGLYEPGRRTFGTFRHTFSTNVVNSGCSVVQACDMTGHTNPKTLLGYVKPNVAALRERLKESFRYAEKPPEDIVIKPKQQHAIPKQDTTETAGETGDPPGEGQALP